MNVQNPDFEGIKVDKSQYVDCNAVSLKILGFAVSISVRITVANFSMNSSLAPKLARPISWENSAKAESAKSGTWPINSWQTSGSGVYIGREEWRMYWVEWNTRNANPAKKSRDESSPATGRRVNPVVPEKERKQMLNLELRCVKRRCQIRDC